jgi:hypothetical protein
LGEIEESKLEAFMICTKNIQSGMKNEILEENVPIHFWHQFSLEYPPHLVECRLSKLNVDKENFVLEPFCEIGKTLVEWIKDIRTNCIETDPIAFFASKLKTITNLSVENQRDYLGSIINYTIFSFRFHDFRENLKISEIFTRKNQVKIENVISLKESQMKRLLENRISETAYRKILIFRNITQTIGDLKTQKFVTFSFADPNFEKDIETYIGHKLCRKKSKNDIESKDCHLNNKKNIRDLQTISNYRSIAMLISESMLKMSRQFGKNILCKMNYVKTSRSCTNKENCRKSVKLESLLLRNRENDKCQLGEVRKSLFKNNDGYIYSKDKDRDYIKYLIE